MFGDSEKNKYNLMNMYYDEMKHFLIENDAPISILNNLYKDVHKWHIKEIEELNINQKRRNILKNLAIIPSITLEKKSISQTHDSIKYMFRLYDGECVEAVLLFIDDKITLCVSSQVGCSIGCKFCATGLMGFKRNLEVWEILSQVYNIADDCNKSINNIVYMGMGEPMLNYDNVIKSAHIINCNFGMNIGSQRISISTVGIIPMMERFIEEKQPFHLILSLHSAIQEKREKLIPISKKYNVDELIRIIKLYYYKRKDWITVAYVMILNFNMGNEDIIRLKEVLGNLKCKLNLISYNKVDEIDEYLSPSIEEAKIFHDAFCDLNIPVNIRKTIGQDINGACGQLVVRKLTKEA